MILDIETQVPGFGGLYVDSAGNVVGVVNDLQRAEDARAAVRAHLSAMPDAPRGVDGSPAEIQVRQGEFGFAQLVSWQRALREAGVHRIGANLLDADEMRNRVRVGVPNSSSEESIRLLAEQLGIPAEAIHFEQRSGTIRTAASVRDRIRPTRGGIETRRWVGPTTYYECSLGVNVTNSVGTRYFLTASHCTGNYSGPTGVAFHSLTNSGSNRLGVESVNPAWSTTTCSPTANKCRSADVALVLYDAGVTVNKEVAETSTVGTGNNPGNLTIGTYRDIIGKGDGLMGQTVYRTGRYTGTTSGPITATCDDIITNDGLEVTCSHRAAAFSGPGDSGGPVYAWSFPLQVGAPERFARGIYWGYYYPGLGGQTEILYGPWSVIETELGMTLTPW